MEVPTDRCFVPKDAIRDTVRLGGVVQDQTLVILGTSIHDLTKLVKVWEDTKERLVEVLSVLSDVITERKDIVHVGTDHRGHVHTVLGRHHEEYLPVSAIHKKLSDGSVPHKRPVVHTIVHEDKDGATLSNSQELLLTIDDSLKGITVIVSKDKEVRYKLFIVPVSLLSP